MARVLQFPRESAASQAQQADRGFDMPVRRFQFVRGIARALGLIGQRQKRARGVTAHTVLQIGELHVR